jgi:MFS family permease
MKESTNRRYFPWVLLILLAVFMSTYRGSVLPVLALRLDSYFSITAASLGFLLSASSLGRIVINLTAGPALDIMGPRKMLSIGFAGYIIVFLFAALAKTFILFLFSVIAIGIFAAVINLSAPLYILKLYPHWQRKSFSLNMVSGLLPGLFFPVIIEYFMNNYPEHFSLVLHLPFGILSGISVFLFLLFHYRAPGRELKETAPRDFKEEMVTSLSKYRFLLTRKGFWIFPVLLFLHGGADSMLHSWMPTYLKKSFAVLPMGTGTVLMLFAAGYFLSRIFLIFLPDHKWRRFFMIFPGITGGTILLAGLLTKNALVISLAYPVGGFFWSFEAPALLSEAYRRFPNIIGTAQALIMLVSAIAGILTINITGILADAGVSLHLLVCAASGLYIAFSIVAAFSTLGTQEGE